MIMYGKHLLSSSKDYMNGQIVAMFKKNKFLHQGFSVLELVMVMAVSTIIMTSLFEIYNQVTRNAQKIEQSLVIDADIVTLENRLYKDFLGISAMWFTQADLERDRMKKNKQLQEGALQSPESEKKSSRYFYSINKQTNLDVMTFVTTNGLQSFDTTRDRFVRVVYKLEPDVRYDGKFRLMRKEIIPVTEVIDDKILQSGKFYELAGNISSLETTFYYIDQEAIKKEQSIESDKNKTGLLDQNNKEAQEVIRSVKEWKEEKKKKEKSNNVNQDQEDLDGAAVPKIIELKISFGLRNDPAAKEYTLSFYISSNIDQIVQSIKKTKKIEPQQNISADHNSERLAT